jgi:6-phosphogluconate dehydrogenase
MNRVVVVFGVSGCGKTTVGKRLSDKTGIPFFDADDFHPRANIEKMAKGRALNDQDREPWLEALSVMLGQASRSRGAILACSALKEKYREKLAERTDEIHWVYLKGDFEMIEKRMIGRKDHFMKSEMLRSQFEALEEPDYGIVMHVEESPEKITDRIILKLNMKHKSVFGLYGLGVMGRSLGLNIADKGFEISVYNRAEGGEETVVRQFMEQNDSYENVRGFTDLSGFVESLERPRRILLMIKAGPVVDQVVKQILPLLSQGDVLIDGGNSHYTDTERRIEELRSSGIGYIGAGISGGEEGARKGPSIMPGGDEKEYAKVSGVLEAIAAKDASGNPCCEYIGPGGSGHFIKMVHNGIEYVEMQLLAELFALLKDSRSNEEIASLFEKWNAGSLGSFLLEITVSILRKKEGDVHLLDRILDSAGNKGTGSWSSKAAMDLGVPNTMMTSAVFERYISSFKKRREKLASAVSAPLGTAAIPEDMILEQAYSFARLVNHQQGFQLLGAASKEYGWNLDFTGIARIWSNGCIIKSALMNRLESSFRQTEDILSVNGVQDELIQGETAVGRLLESGIRNRVALSCFSASRNYWINMTTSVLPANLIQAQRDFFGAHTYQRTDDPSGASHHTNWS